jgi:hypothetical protein
MLNGWHIDQEHAGRILIVAGCTRLGRFSRPLVEK